MKNGIVPSALFILLLAGCAPPPEPLTANAANPPTRTLTHLEPAQAQAALAERLASLDFLVATEPDLVRAEIPEDAPPKWFDCERIVVEDDQALVRRIRFADPESLRVWLEVRIGRADGQTSVTFDPYYEGIYLNRFTNLSFREPCASTGRLETLLFSAVGGT